MDGSRITGSRGDVLACVACVERGRGNLGARESVWSRALIPFPFPFERMPRKIEMCLSLEHQNPSKTAEKNGLF